MNENRLKELQAAFERDGFVYLPGFFTPAQVKEMNSELSAFIDQVVPVMPARHVVYEDRSKPDTLKQLQDLQIHSTFFNNLMCSSELVPLAEALLHEKVIGKNVEYFNKPARIGKATPPHQDAFYFNLKPPQALTMWIALEEAGTDNGCVSYIAGSHKQGMRPHGRTQTSGFSQAITDYGTGNDLSCLRSFPAGPGDLLIHHCMTIHLAGANTTESRSRKALGLIYFGSSAQPDLEAREAYRRSLESVQINIA